MVKKMGFSQKDKKRQQKSHSDYAEPAAKRTKTQASEPEFSHVRFKFLLRSPETVVTALQTFLDNSANVEDDEDGGSLKLLDSYLRSSPQCSEVLELLTPKASAQEVSLVFAWLRHVLEKCPTVTQTFSELQQHLVKTLLSRHGHLIVNSVRRGNKIGHIQSTLMLLITIASLSNKFAKLLFIHMDFTHANWPGLLSQRDRKEEADVRACMTAILMTLLQADDEEITKTLVEQHVLLQEVMTGLKYDRSEYVVHTLKTIHRCIILNGGIGKNPKMYLFNSPVLKELLTLYHWPGPGQWKRQPTEDEKKEYSEEQKTVAEWLHPMLIDLLTNHKLGICFRDKSFGLFQENKNPVVRKVLQLMVTSYSSPLSHRLVTSILQSCPDQCSAFLKLLQPHLSPRPVDTWLTCLRFFLQIVENHEWPAALMEDLDAATEERTSQVVQVLFPPESTIGILKDGLKHACATVRHQCLQAIGMIAIRGRHFCSMSRNKLGDQAPVTLAIEGFVHRTLPGAQVLLNLLQKCSSTESFAVPITRDLYKDTEVPLPHVSRFQHLVAILRMYSLVPEHLTGGPVDTLPQLLTLVAQLAGSEDPLDSPPDGTQGSLPSLCLLHALSECDVRKLTLFGKGGSKGDVKQSLMYQLVCLIQAQSGDADKQTAHLFIVKLLMGTGLFDGNKRELAIWLQHLQTADSAPHEVVAFFVGLLRQYMSNPYPALDRVLEYAEETSQLTEDRYLSDVRLEFSPLVMFALEGDFSQQDKVSQYISSVLIDILHSLHNPCGFSRLVHSLSSNLDPEVTQYLTLHTTDEEATSKSIMKRMCKKTRLKLLKSTRHTGVTLMKKLLKEGEVTPTVEKLSADGCLSVIQQSLRYLDEQVLASAKTEGDLLNKRLGEVCVKTLKAAILRLADITRSDSSTPIADRDDAASAMDVDKAGSQADSSDSQHDDDDEKIIKKKKQPQSRSRRFSGGSDSSMDEQGSDDDLDNEKDDASADDNADGDDKKDVEDRQAWIVVPNRYCAALRKDEDRETSTVSDVSQLRTDWLREAVACVLSHPLISQWLFAEGFTQGGTPREWVVSQLCDIVHTLGQLNIPHLDTVVDVRVICRRLVDKVTEAGSGVSAQVQPLLCQCLEALCAVGGAQHRLEGLMSVLSLPVQSFLSQSSPPLVQTLFRMAEAETTTFDGKLLKELYSREKWASSFKGLFDLLSGLTSQQLEGLALRCVQCVPQLALACSSGSFQGLLNRLVGEASSSGLQTLVECLMANSPQCWSACGQWLKGKARDMKRKRGQFAPVMLVYLRLLSGMKDSAADDSGLCAISEAVCNGLDSPSLGGDHGQPSFLQVVCHLVNADRIEMSVMQKLQDHVLTLAKDEASLQEGHVQLLAAILRQQSMDACDLDRKVGEGGEGWRSFEVKAGRVLLGCLRYLTSGRLRMDTGDSGLQAGCTLMVHLCHSLLSLTILPDVKAEILTLWPSIVLLCLKYHYKDIQYVSLLHRLVLTVFAEDEETLEVDIVADEEPAIISKTSATAGCSDDDDSDDDEEDDNDTAPLSAKTSDPKTTPQRTSNKTQQSKKNFSVTVTESARRFGIVRKSDIAKKCIALLSEEVDNKFPNNMVSRWIWSGPACKSFFLWPSQRVTPALSKARLASPSHGRRLVDLCEKVVGHTGFLAVLRGGEHAAVRGELVSMLAGLVRLEKACCRSLPLTALLAAYGATLSLTDQNLLYLMLACDLHGNQRFKPGVWGEKAVEQLELKKDLGKWLPNEISLHHVLELLDPSTMTASILHFPLMRTMEFRQNECAVKAERMMSRDDCYDPRFLLQVFFHFMGPEHIMDVRTFLTSKALGLVLAALSSHDALMRQLAIGILANVHSHVELVPRWSCAPILLAFLKVLMCGVTREGQKLPAIVTIFLAKASDFFMKPESDMYVGIHSFLMLKPGLDVNNVPEFYHFFNSPKPKERVWMLQLLKDGLRETSDHRLFQRRFVYKLLTCHANSSLSDNQTRRESLKVLVKACSIATVAKDLVSKHGFLSWLVSFIKETLPDADDSTRLVCQLLHNVCYTPEFNRQRLWWLSLTRQSRQCLLQTPLLVSVRLLLETFSHLEVGSVDMLLDILQHPHLTPSTTLTLLPLVVMVTWHLGRLENDTEMVSVATDLSESLHFRLPSVTNVKPQRKDGAQEKDGQSSRIEMLAQLRKRNLELLSKCQKQELPLNVGDGSSVEYGLCVRSSLSKLNTCLTK